jgi:hypothetical protein
MAVRTTRKGGWGTHKISDWMKFFFADFVKVFIDVLVWQIATNEDTVDLALRAGEPRQSTCSLSLFQIVQQTLKSQLCIHRLPPHIPWRLKPDDGPQINPSRQSCNDRPNESLDPTSSIASIDSRQGNSTGVRRARDLGPGTRSPATVQTLDTVSA